ncbi:MAG: hypothetical protein KJ882_04635, partial [Proteobacteria bacterium]|nr:hypothetical protein [Pseudomonadota bacterium]
MSENNGGIVQMRLLNSTEPPIDFHSEKIHYVSHFQNVSVWSRSRRMKILTAGIHGVFRGLKFS